MKIVVFEFEEWQRDYFKSLEDAYDLTFEPLPLSLEVAASYKSVEIITTFIKSDLSENALSKFKNLKLIATRSTGYDHIDLDYCRQNNITVCNVPAYGENTIAEYVFAMILSLSRKIPETLDRTKNKNFSRDGLQGFDLLEKTIGIIGTGTIGKHVIKIANGFGMTILAYDIFPDNSYAVTHNFSYVSLETLLKQSDIVSLHVPANEQTQNMIARDKFLMMKRGAMLINTARGYVVNYDDLLEALQNGQLSSAALDVFPDEAQFFTQKKCRTLETNNKLLEMENVIVTPHNAYNTIEAVNRIVEMTVENIENFSNGISKNLIL